MKSSGCSVPSLCLSISLIIYVVIAAPPLLSLPIVGHFLPTLQNQLDKLPAEAQERALTQLEKMGNLEDPSIQLDITGRVFFIENSVHLPQGAVDNHLSEAHRRTISDTPITRLGPGGVPLLHSLPGSPNVIYLNFLGGQLVNRAWNDNYGIPVIQALPYSLDSNNAFSAQEIVSMANIWRRVAEDYSPWMVDVTTERPAAFTSTVLEAMITKSVDAAGVNLPASFAGGIAYLDIIGFYDALYYSPALIYFNNLAGGREDVVAEAVSHELGHNFGLSHDGVSGGSSYYSGAGGVSPTSWGPIMGAAYFRSVTKFNNGDYPGANNQEDDLAIISSSFPLRTDEVGNTLDTAMRLTTSGGSFSFSSLIEWYTDVDVFYMDITGGTVSIFAKPYTSLVDTVGNNLDIALQLLDSSGNILVTSDPTNSSSASISVNNLLPGRFYVKVYAVGNSVTPYSVYGSMGQYDLSGQFNDAGITTTTTSTSTTTTRPTTTSTSTATTRPTTTTSLPTTTGVGYTKIYEASMVSYPSGWSVNIAGTWSYGKPTSTFDPHDFFVVGNVISGTGLYPEPITTPQLLASKAFSTVGYSAIKLEFDRFLGVQSDDTVTVYACAGSECSLLWQNSGQIIDTVWTKMTLDLPTSMRERQSVQIKFGIGPTQKSGDVLTNSFGWNIKNFVVSGFNPIAETSTTTRPTTVSTTMMRPTTTSVSYTQIYAASMASYPTGWSVNTSGTWFYGKPTSTFDPHDFVVVGTVISGTGLYPEPITAPQLLISKAFSTVGFSAIKLEFDRFLGVKADDTVTVYACAGSECSLLWQNSGEIIDTAWTKVTLNLPMSMQERQSVQIKFGIGPTQKSGDVLTNSFGWNIKNFVISGQLNLTTQATTTPPSTTTTTAVDTTIFTESMVSYPAGWSVNTSGTWFYGKPTSTFDPHEFAVVGTVISGTGLYPEPITAPQLLISKEFSTAGFSSVRLEFDRYLGIKADDVVTVYACVESTCSLLWQNSGEVIDSAWTRITLPLPPMALNQAKVKIKFGLGPTQKSGDVVTNSFGWNIKGIAVIGRS